MSLSETLRNLVLKLGVRRALALFLASLWVAKETVWKKLQYRLYNRAPGPMPFPIVGTFPYLSPPNTLPGIHEDFLRLSKRYGPVYSLWFGNKYAVVVNDIDSFYEVMKTKQDEFAHRPNLESFDIITHGQGVAMNNGKRWRMIRTTLMQRVTNKQKGVESEAQIAAEIQNSLHWLLKNRCEVGRGNDFDLRQLCRRESLNQATMKFFSFRFGNECSQAYYEMQDWIRVIFEFIAQGNPADFMPLFKIFPNKAFEDSKVAALKMEKFIDAEIERHREAFPTKPAEKYDFIDEMFVAQAEAKKTGEPTLTDIDIRVTAWDALAGFIDTSATTMEWLIYVLIEHKHVLKKLHEIMDREIGPDRLPTLDDIPKLEYLTAIIDEIFRWRHFAPQGLPHEAAVDTTLCGYDIPKGTQVFINYHSPHMNPKYWKKPEEFRPERFMEEERELLYTVLHPEKAFPKKDTYKFVPFGQGRRRCVGYGIGRIVMWLKAALWLHCFDWDRADPNKPLDIDTGYLGITLVPIEQKVRATPRPAAKLLRSLEGRSEFDTR